MQAVKRRTDYAIKRAVQKANKKRELKQYDEMYSRKQERVRMARHQSSLVRNARKNRREDWELGPLAPRRDVGDLAERYGTLSMYNFQTPEYPEGRAPESWHLSEGDRVVVIRGRERGNIGVIGQLDAQRGTVALNGVNVVDLEIPDFMNAEGNKDSNDRFNAQARPISVQDVRLLYPLADAQTGVPRDVMIERLIKIDDNVKEYEKTPHWLRNPDEPAPEPMRAIPGTNILIPRPERAPPADEEENEVDSKLMTVEEETFRPYLLHPPMPLSVIDELRHRYSKFRTRHSWEFTQKIEAQEARQGKRQGLVSDMRTPLQELAEMRKSQQVKRELTDEQLARIGEVIARERAGVNGLVEGGGV